MSIQVERLRKELPHARIPALQEHAEVQGHSKQQCRPQIRLWAACHTTIPSANAEISVGKNAIEDLPAPARVLQRAATVAEHRASAERYGERHGLAILLFSCALFLSPRRRTSPCLPSC